MPFAIFRARKELISLLMKRCYVTFNLEAKLVDYFVTQALIVSLLAEPEATLLSYVQYFMKNKHGIEEQLIQTRAFD